MKAMSAVPNQLGRKPPNPDPPGIPSPTQGGPNTPGVTPHSHSQSSSGETTKPPITTTPARPTVDLKLVHSTQAPLSTPSPSPATCTPMLLMAPPRPVQSPNTVKRHWANDQQQSSQHALSSESQLELTPCQPASSGLMSSHPPGISSGGVSSPSLASFKPSPSDPSQCQPTDTSPGRVNSPGIISSKPSPSGPIPSQPLSTSSEQISSPSLVYNSPATADPATAEPLSTSPGGVSSPTSAAYQPTTAGHSPTQPLGTSSKEMSISENRSHRANTPFDGSTGMLQPSPDEARPEFFTDGDGSQDSKPMPAVNNPTGHVAPRSEATGSKSPSTCSNDAAASKTPVLAINPGVSITIAGSGTAQEDALGSSPERNPPSACDATSPVGLPPCSAHTSSDPTPAKASPPAIVTSAGAISGPALAAAAPPGRDPVTAGVTAHPAPTNAPQTARGPAHTDTDSDPLTARAEQLGSDPATTGADSRPALTNPPPPGNLTTRAGINSRPLPAGAPPSYGGVMPGSAKNSTAPAAARAGHSIPANGGMGVPPTGTVAGGVSPSFRPGQMASRVDPAGKLEDPNLQSVVPSTGGPTQGQTGVVNAPVRRVPVLNLTESSPTLDLGGGRTNVQTLRDSTNRQQPQLTHLTNESTRMAVTHLAAKLASAGNSTCAPHKPIGMTSSSLARPNPPQGPRAAPSSLNRTTPLSTPVTITTPAPGAMPLSHTTSNPSSTVSSSTPTLKSSASPVVWPGIKNPLPTTAGLAGQPGMTGLRQSISSLSNASSLGNIPNASAPQVHNQLAKPAVSKSLMLNNGFASSTAGVARRPGITNALNRSSSAPAPAWQQQQQNTITSATKQTVSQKLLAAGHALSSQQLNLTGGPNSSYQTAGNSTRQQPLHSLNTVSTSMSQASKHEQALNQLVPPGKQGPKTHPQPSPFQQASTLAGLSNQHKSVVYPSPSLLQKGKVPYINTQPGQACSNNAAQMKGPCQGTGLQHLQRQPSQPLSQPSLHKQASHPHLQVTSYPVINTQPNKQAHVKQEPVHQLKLEESGTPTAHHHHHHHHHPRLPHSLSAPHLPSQAQQRHPLTHLPWGKQTAAQAPLLQTRSSVSGNAPWYTLVAPLGVSATPPADGDTAQLVGGKVPIPPPVSKDPCHTYHMGLGHHLACLALLPKKLTTATSTSPTVPMVGGQALKAMRGLLVGRTLRRGGDRGLKNQVVVIDYDAHTGRHKIKNKPEFVGENTNPTAEWVDLGDMEGLENCWYLVSDKPPPAEEEEDDEDRYEGSSDSQLSAPAVNPPLMHGKAPQPAQPGPHGPSPATLASQAPSPGLRPFKKPRLDLPGGPPATGMALVNNPAAHALLSRLSKKVSPAVEVLGVPHVPVGSAPKMMHVLVNPWDVIATALQCGSIAPQQLDQVLTELEGAAATPSSADSRKRPYSALDGPIPPSTHQDAHSPRSQANTPLPPWPAPHPSADPHLSLPRAPSASSPRIHPNPPVSMTNHGPGQARHVDSTPSRAFDAPSGLREPVSNVARYSNPPVSADSPRGMGAPIPSPFQSAPPSHLQQRPPFHRNPAPSPFVDHRPSGFDVPDTVPLSHRPRIKNVGSSPCLPHLDMPPTQRSMPPPTIRQSSAPERVHSPAVCSHSPTPFNDQPYPMQGDPNTPREHRLHCYPPNNFHNMSGSLLSSPRDPSMPRMPYPREHSTLMRHPNVTGIPSPSHMEPSSLDHGNPPASSGQPPMHHTHSCSDLHGLNPRMVYPPVSGGMSHVGMHHTGNRESYHNAMDPSLCLPDHSDPLAALDAMEMDPHMTDADFNMKLSPLNLPSPAGKLPLEPILPPASQQLQPAPSGLPALHNMPLPQDLLPSGFDPLEPLPSIEDALGCVANIGNSSHLKQEMLPPSSLIPSGHTTPPPAQQGLPPGDSPALSFLMEDTLRGMCERTQTESSSSSMSPRMRGGHKSLSSEQQIKGINPTSQGPPLSPLHRPTDANTSTPLDSVHTPRAQRAAPGIKSLPAISGALISPGIGLSPGSSMEFCGEGVGLLDLLPDSLGTPGSIARLGRQGLLDLGDDMFGSSPHGVPSMAQLLDSMDAVFPA